MRKFNIERPDRRIEDSIRHKIDNLNKPKGSLGRLESIAMQICLIEQTLHPTLHKPQHILLGADHGIEREGVSVSPREVTWQQMVNFTKGGGGVNMFCRQHGFKLHIVDMGVDHDLGGYPAITDRKIARGTADFLYGPAMSLEQMDKAVETGDELAAMCLDEGSDIICIGEMGIGNTSASSVWMSELGGVALDKCIGAGAGLDSPGLAHKRKVLAEATGRYHRWKPDAGVTDCIRYFGGFEMVAAVGLMLGAAERRLVVMVDGFIMSACALAATKLVPEARDYMIFGHQGDENGHRRLLQLLHAEPLLQLGMRLGEGTGALCAFPIIDSAVRMMNEMNDFEHANITKYF